MNVALRYLPSAAVGLGIGLLVARGMVPDKQDEAPSPAASTPPPSALSNLDFGPAALRNVVDAINPSPDVPELVPSGNPTQYRVDVMKSLNEASKLGATSPYRAQLAAELIRHEVDPIVSVWSGAGSADIESGTRVYERLAAERPTYALSQIDGDLRNGFSAHDYGAAQTHRRAVLRVWLQDDPASALAEVTKQSVSRNRAMSGFRRSMRTHALMREWGELDPAAAAAALPTLPESGPAFGRAHFAESLVEGWFERDPAAARAWIEQDAAPEWRDGLRELAVLLERGDPNATSDVLLKHRDRNAR